MKLNSLEDLQPARKEVVVPVPELAKDGEIIVREMSAGRMSEFQKYSNADESLADEHLLIACMVDEEGDYIIGHERALELKELFSYDVHQRLTAAIVTLHPYLFDKKKESKQS